MLKNVPETVSKVILHTGNMLYTTDVTKQVHMAATEQIVQGLITNLKIETIPPPSGEILQIKKAILLNQTDEDKKNLQTMIKVFVNTGKVGYLKEALKYTISDLKLPCVDSVILVYQNKLSNSDNLLKELLEMWKVVEKFVEDGSVGDIGIADIDTETFVKMYNSVKVKPAIHQINLSACCVVPQDLKEFCKERDIRILTHNDPSDILPSADLKPLFFTKDTDEGTFNEHISNLQINWITRFQAHIKCRGILSNKGYIVCLNIK